MALMDLIINRGRYIPRNHKLHSDEENAKWCWKRAEEWVTLPLVLSPVVVPVLLFIWPWQLILTLVIMAGWGWHYLMKRGSLDLDPLGAAQFEYVITLKWVFCPAGALYYLVNGRPTESIVCFVWLALPLLLHVRGLNSLLMLIAPQIPVRPIQEKLMMDMGYSAQFARRMKE